MNDDHGKSAIGNRRAARVDLDGEVTIRFDAGAISGSGQNISSQGVFFTADGTLPVTVSIAGKGEVCGRLVRLESMGDGRIGVAVRFDEDEPTLVPVV
jgi:hypothetical protein